MADTIVNASGGQYLCTVYSSAGVKHENEDCWFCDGEHPAVDASPEEKRLTSRQASGSTEGVHIFAVCDGMGGEAGGSIASGYAVACIADYQAKLAAMPAEERAASLDGFYKEMNAGLLEKAEADDGKYHGMGTTIAMVVIDDGKVIISNAGDSVVFICRAKPAAGAKQFERLTEMDNLSYQLYKQGKLTEKDLYTHKCRSILMEYIGKDEEAYGELSYHVYDPITLSENDILVICCDGVTEKLDEKELASLIMPYTGMARKGLFRKPVTVPVPETPLAQALVEKAAAAGTRDNITALTIQIK